MENNQLVLKSVNQLFQYSFYIPAYQRGYRRTEKQVEQLLNDVWQFAKNPPQYDKGEEKPFYCLQPVVVKKHGDNNWEVIDGQQRLTTIYLILKNLENQIERDQKNFTRIFYETRPDSEEFLKNVQNYTSDQACINIDYYHIHQAYHTIQKWFQHIANTTDDASPRAEIAPVLLRDTKVIWYETEETESNHSIDIFTRLNIGKIPLTNAELIKALFLQKGNFTEEKATLKQIQIASEWDMIEKTLQDNAFWYFIYNPRNPLKYENRIEYIFDLMKNRTKDSEYYYTFNEFHKDFTSYTKENRPDIDKIWLDIKKYFLTFEEWYKDYELFHYIGYLIECGLSVETIKTKYTGEEKNKFKTDYLTAEIKKQVNCKIDTLEYPDKPIRKILLLFNIQTILHTHKSDMRFPFHKYKSEDWDIEHVCSQTNKTISAGKRHEWVNDILEFFAGTAETVKVEEYIQEITDEDNRDVKDICQRLVSIQKEEKITDEKFDAVYKTVQEYFHETQTEEKNDISNLALLDAATNRSYGNAFFPIKRKRIIRNDSSGIFVPIATKNLFLKYYSPKLSEMMYWTRKDAECYLKAIKSTLKNFLPQEEAQ